MAEQLSRRRDAGPATANELAGACRAPKRMVVEATSGCGRAAILFALGSDSTRVQDVGEVWLDEAERRLKTYDDGTTGARDIDDALAEIERQLI